MLYKYADNESDKRRGSESQVTPILGGGVLGGIAGLLAAKYIFERKSLQDLLIGTGAGSVLGGSIGALINYALKEDAEEEEKRKVDEEKIKRGSNALARLTIGPVVSPSGSTIHDSRYWIDPNIASMTAGVAAARFSPNLVDRVLKNIQTAAVTKRILKDTAATSGRRPFSKFKAYLPYESSYAVGNVPKEVITEAKAIKPTILSSILPSKFARKVATKSGVNFVAGNKKSGVATATVDPFIAVIGWKPKGTSKDLLLASKNKIIDGSSFLLATMLTNIALNNLLEKSVKESVENK